MFSNIPSCKIFNAVLESNSHLPLSFINPKTVFKQRLLKGETITVINSCQEIYSSSCLQFALLRNYIVNLLRILPNPWSKHISNYEIKWQVVVHENCQNKMFVGQKQWIISLFWKSVSYFRIRTCFMKLSSFNIYFYILFFIN